MNNLDFILNNIKQYNYIFLDSKNIEKNRVKKKIFYIIKELFPKLNSKDIDILQHLTAYLIEKIAFLMFPIETSDSYQKNRDYYTQFIQNNYRDTKSICLMILPFINIDSSPNAYQEITRLQQILFTKDKDFITTKDINKNEKKSRMNEFKYSNMAVSLFSRNGNNLLNLKPNNIPLIYDIIYHNYLSIISTLKMINGKLFINWINITPLNLENYKQSKIYQRTMRGIEYLKNTFQNENFDYYNFSQKYNGIWLGDIYNVFRMVMYESVKKLKWLIFPYKNTRNKYTYIIQILDLTLIDLSTILNRNIINTEKIKLKIDTIIFLIKSKSNYKHITYQSIEKTYKYLLVWFVNNYKYRNNINKNIINTFLIKKTTFLDNDEIKHTIADIENITSEQIISSLEDIKTNINDLIYFLVETIDQFKNNFYSSFLINDDNTINHSFSIVQNTKKLNIKNLYNYAKLLSIKQVESQKGNVYFLNENFKALTPQEKKDFLNKILNITEYKKWFFINGAIKKQENNDQLTNNQINDIYNQIVEDIKKINFEFVFEILIKNGLLSQFKTNLYLTDEKRLPKGTKEQRKEIKKRLKNTIFKENEKDFLNSYYFLTNKKFQNLTKLRKENIINPFNPKEKTYFDNLTDTKSRMEWFTFYAMDWISQINFFNHYIHKQLILVTGSTGTGKSTQVPKLLTYALKMCDFKLYGRIVCTQPRIAPTKGNAIRIASEMGVYIEKISKAYGKKIKTNEYYIQYKYQKGKHEYINTNHLQLKMVTDGSLFQELFSNPMLKETFSIYDKNTNTKKIDKYTLKNLYDIFIIDEAHEHNVNMDLILTKMRQHCYYNNSLKLVIISATMDDDEAIYRKYYRCLNDDMIYPSRDELLFPLFANQNRKIIQYFSLFIDRRFHISPPGQTTQYIITEIYENLPESTQLDNKENAKIAQKHGYQVAIKIAKTTSDGPILFFSTGQREILDAVKYLNTHLPKNTIALPFFSKINETNKDIILDIKNKIRLIKTEKHLIHKNYDKEYTDGSVQKGTYKRAIILATNVAEASVTIDGLKYVIDNGYEKVNIYDENTNTSKLDFQKISESSRLQRKGRVGRVEDGTVYYLYKKNARKKIKPKYKIVNENISENIIKMTTEDSTVENSFLPIDIFKELLIDYDKFKEYFDSDSSKLLTNCILSDICNEKDYNLESFKKIIKNKYTISDNLINIIFKQKYILSALINNSEYLEYFGFLLNEDYDNIYNDGYKFETLLDKDGQFYLIHPQETKLIRNINRDIIGMKTEIKKINKNGVMENRLKENFKITKIPDELFAKIKNQMLSKLRLIKVKDEKNEKSWKKTALNNQFLDFSSSNNINFEDQEILTILLSVAHGSLNEMIGIIALLKASEYNIENLVANKNKKEIYWDEFYSLYKNKYSDLVGLLNIFNNFRNKFKFKIFDINLSNYNDNQLKSNYLNMIKKYINALEKTNNYLDPFLLSKDKLIDYKIYQKLNQLKYSHKLLSKNDYIELNDQKSSVNYFITKEIDINIDKIKSWCKYQFLNFETFQKFIEHYQEIVLSIYGMKKNDNFTEKITSLEWMKKLTKSLSFGNNKQKYDHIIKPFIQASPLNICIQTKFNNNYYKDIQSCCSTNNKLYLNDRNLIENTPYILSFQKIILNNHTNKNNLNIISIIDESWLPNFFPFYYNPDSIRKYIYYNSNLIYTKPTINHSKGELFDNFLKNIKNNWKMLKPIWIDEKNLPIITESINTVIKGTNFPKN